jgi:hypothetical protein
LHDDIDSSKIGKMVYEPLISFDLTKCAKTFNLKSKITSFQSFKQALILENKNIIILFNDSSNKSNICLFDHNYNLKKILINPNNANYNNDSYGSDYKPTFFYLGNQMLAYYNYNYSYRLVIVNQDLVVQKKTDCINKYTSLCGNSEKIIGLHKGKLDIYNYNLKLLQTVDQTDSNSLPFYVDSSNIIDNDANQVPFSIKNVLKSRKYNIK